MPNKVALVLSGGGAKGAFQAGALQYLDTRGFKYDLISGVSVGSLNGGMIAQNKLSQLLQLWGSISDVNVYSGTNILSEIYSALVKKSIYSNAPLLSEIQNNFHIKDFVIPFWFGVTSLITGQYYSLDPQNFDNDVDLANAVLASTAMPVIWPPIDVIDHDGKILQCVDGGLRNLTPLGDVVGFSPTHVVIINCSNRKLASDTTATNNIIKIAERSILDIMCNQVFDDDLDVYLKVNELIQQAQNQNFILKKSDGSPYQYFKTLVIEPSTDLGDSLDFSNNQYKMQLGASAAKSALTTIPNFLT